MLSFLTKETLACVQLSWHLLSARFRLSVPSRRRVFWMYCNYLLSLWYVSKGFLHQHRFLEGQSLPLFIRPLIIISSYKVMDHIVLLFERILFSLSFLNERFIYYNQHWPFLKMNDQTTNFQRITHNG